jgi:Peptidase family C25
MSDKLIVTNRSALRSKYGNKGLLLIRKAVALLRSADKNRGLKSRVVYLDDKPTLKKLGGAAVQNATNPRENKAAIDAVCKALKPDYLLILGALDVVPHQDISNPVYEPPDDDDINAWGDLPYACDVPYSKDPAQFIGPTRVVGRLPDLVRATEPSYLLALLKFAANHQKRTKADYQTSFGLSAKIWEASTRLSLTNSFGNADTLLLSPPSGPKYPGRKLRNRMHFINCHGGPSSPEFQGQLGKKYPIALTTRATLGEIIEGTVAAVECCYGAELYDAITLGIDLPICQSYLKQGAYGYLGSTTIAYGPKAGNGSADLICQYFLQHVLEGASLGRATLLAQQQFVANAAQMDPIDLKTLAQFYLLGDPSIHPIEVPRADVLPKGQATGATERFFRAERRIKMTMTGQFLAKSKPTASKRAKSSQLSVQGKSALANIAKASGLSPKLAFTAFVVRGAPKASGRTAKAVSAPSRYFIAISSPTASTAGPTTTDKIQRGVAVVAKELGGRIVDYRIYYQH